MLTFLSVQTPIETDQAHGYKLRQTACQCTVEGEDGEVADGLCGLQALGTGKPERALTGCWMKEPS